MDPNSGPIDFPFSGTLPVPDAPKTREGLRARAFILLTAFFMTFMNFLRSVMCHITRKLPDALPNSDQNTTECTVDANNEDYRPPSPTPAFTEADVLSAVVKRLGELEEKVDTLQSKPSRMPFEKEELLNAAVCRVDALEAELIATKKALYEALMRQEELLAYIDRQEEARLRKKKSCW